MAKTKLNSKKDERLKKPKGGAIAIKNIISNDRLVTAIGLILIYSIFFFFIKDKLLYTPDFDRSDAFHLNVALKYHLAQAVKHGSLPFWTDSLQGGFPLLAEGQMGALFFPNLLFLSLLPFTLGYNLLFIFSLFLISFGSYLLLRKISVAPLMALLISLTFTFCGTVSFQWVHLNIVQAFSLTPLLIYTILVWHEKRDIKSAALTTLLFSQTLLAGQSQIAMISYMGICMWYGVLVFSEKKEVGSTVKASLPFFMIVLISITLALPQIIPSFMLSLNSSRELINNYIFSTSYSFPMKNLLAYFVAYPYGNPRMATHPPFTSDAGIFWENSPYFGPLFLIMAMLALVVLLLKRIRLPKTIYFGLGLAFFFLLLSLGNNSPIYFIFDLPPFNLFRVPARYLFMANMFLVISVALVFHRFLSVSKNLFIRYAIYGLLAVNLLYLIVTVFRYHTFVKAGLVLRKPPVTDSILAGTRYLSFAYDKQWHMTFTKRGWNKPEDVARYIYLNNFLIPNANLIYDYGNFDINTGGLSLRRVDYLNDLMKSVVVASDSASLSPNYALQIMQIAGISTVISDQNEFFGYKPFKSLNQDNLNINLFRLPVNESAYYIPVSVTNIHYLNDFEQLYSLGKVSTSEAVVEGYRSFSQAANGRIDIIKQSDTRLEIKTQMRNDTFVVLRKNWYPEWEVSIDGKAVVPVRTNLIHLGVMVPEGNHTVTANYFPRYFLIGLAISVMCIVGVGGSLIYLKTAKR